MNLDVGPFDEGAGQRVIVASSPDFVKMFFRLKDYVENRMNHIELVHIGSTAVPGLRGKPMIDAIALTECSDRRREQQNLVDLGFHRRDVWVDTDDKPYVCGSLVHQSRVYNINIHICTKDHRLYREALAFIELLRSRPDLCREYEQAKDAAHAASPLDAEKYNGFKAAIITKIMAAADVPDRKS